MYDGGFVGWQEYSDDTMYAVLNLYNAKIEATDALLDKQKEYINNLKEQFQVKKRHLARSGRLRTGTSQSPKYHTN